MRRGIHNQSGFTLVEVMVAGLLIAIAVAGAFGGLRAIARAQSAANDAELLQQLAQEKINDMQLYADPSDVGGQGDFSDRGHSDVTWSSTITTTSITNVDQVTVTAARGKSSQSLTTQLYVVPVASSTTSTTSTSGATP